MQNDISGIVELLRQINNRTANSVYNDPFIDGIHRNFPDLLYNNARFTSVQSVMEYINHQMNNNYNVFNRNFAEYWNTPAPAAAAEPAPAPTVAAASSQSRTPGNIFNQLHGEMIDAARVLSNLSNATTRSATPADSPLLSAHRGTYMDDEILLNGLGTTAIPITPPRPPRQQPNPPPLNERRRVGAREIFRNLIPDFLNFPEPTFFMAGARTFHIHPLNELNQRNENNIGLTQDEINGATHIEERTEGQCPICYDNYSGNDLRVINNCNHAFHSECINRWFMQNRTCPMCRANVLGMQTGAGPAPPPPPSSS
jgi:hypothetical protein